MKKVDNSRILVISDMHIPYEHPDTLKFLTTVKKEITPTRVICMGDELDNHCVSFHDSDPDLPSAGDELKWAIKKLKPIFKLFPEVDILFSNHGSLVFRRALHHGLPKNFIKSMREVLEAPETWNWHLNLLINLPDKNQCYFHHGFVKDPAKAVALRGMCVVQAHYHENAEIQYISNPNALLWGMNVGCLIDKKSMAFAYNSVNLKRPILSVGVIIDSQPRLIPMVLNKQSRWRGYI